VSRFFLSLSLFLLSYLTITQDRSPRASPWSGLASPSVKGAGLSGLSHRLPSATSWKDEPAVGYFFASKSISSREELDPSLYD
jgi:hypothetical protein